MNPDLGDDAGLSGKLRSSTLHHRRRYESDYSSRTGSHDSEFRDSAGGGAGDGTAEEAGDS